jgi:predicted AlkP superfamily phosphohydrolase/phosphomutase
MKLLVLGIDGGDRKIFNSFDLPTINGLLNQGCRYDIEEDLFSRGWPEILSGNHGFETGAFYKKPKLDGTYGFHDKYNTKDYQSDASIEPLWTKLMRMGNKVGFMNIPTTNPAPEVDGFFVSGAGGGHVGLDIPPNSFFPFEVGEDLTHGNYIFDTRFMISGIKDKAELCNQLILMQRQRAANYVILSRKFFPDFGFLTFTSIKVIQYLAMSEILPLIEKRDSATSTFQKNIIRIYIDFDQCIAELLKRLQPKTVMIVSDHGSTPYYTRVNVNHVLQTMGFQRKGIATAAASKSLMKRSLRYIPKPVKNFLNKKTPQIKDYMSKSTIDWQNTQAFGASKIPGIYINDKERFGGPVASQAEMNETIEHIIEEFNSRTQVENKDLKAKAYRREHSSVKYANLLPDIWIDHPDSVYFASDGEFIQANQNFKPIHSLEAVDRDMYTCMKGRYPILHTTSTTITPLEKNCPHNLTLAYKLIDKIMKD